MLRFLALTIFVLVLCGVIVAQVPVPPNCPSIELFGPAGIVPPGEIGRYTVNTGEKGQNLNLKYFWSTSAGEIVSGQGTTSVGVKFPSDSGVTVTIEVIGLPEGCPATASETAIWDPALVAVKLAQFRGPSFTEDKRLSEDIARAVKDYRNNQLYIIVSYKQNTDEESVRTRERRVTEFVLNSTPVINSDRSRMTIVRYPSSIDVIEVWRVPPGADNPLCEACGSASCPVITVTGPAGIIEPGRTVSFVVSIEPDDTLRIFSFEWTVSRGAIVRGQGTTTLDVMPEKYFNQKTTATVMVRGLPDGCPNVVNESFEAVCDPYLVLSDEVSLWTQYFDVSWQEERKNLDSLILEGLKRYPKHIIYLEKTFGKNALIKDAEARVHQIRNYLTKIRKIPKSRFFIRTSRGNRGQTHGYLVPRDAPVLKHDYSDPCLQ